MPRYKMMHASMQFTDTSAKKHADADQLIEYARANQIRWITGTEAGSSTSTDLQISLTQACYEHGYRVWFPSHMDTWCAVDRTLIKGAWRVYEHEVIPPRAPTKNDPGWNSKGVSSVSFSTEVGKIAVMMGHYLTKGDPTAHDPKRRVHVTLNRKLASANGAYAAKVGAGAALVFYGGDQNINDRVGDTFFGAPLTSCWDELKKWPSTGHSTIDVIASYDKDTRVKCVSATSLDDTALFLNTDHWPVVASYDIKELP